MEMDAQILIIGAGAAGLYAAEKLSRSGKKVLVLEARDRLGGRIHTGENGTFPVAVEQGAEFIHGRAPKTRAVLRKAGAAITGVPRKMFRFKNGSWTVPEEFSENWAAFFDHAAQLKSDLVLRDFLQKYFNGPKDAAFRAMVRRFAEGYDLADPRKASTKILSEEWQLQNERQFLVTGGYSQLTGYLARKAVQQGCTLLTSSVVTEINWRKHAAAVHLADQRRFLAEKVLVTIPVGLLAAKRFSPGVIRFTPDITGYRKAAGQIGFGAVTKIQLFFKNPFWEQSGFREGFLISGEAVPTWWTPADAGIPLLTGWLPHPAKPVIYCRQPREGLKHVGSAISSLSAIFGLPPEQLQGMLLKSTSYNWAADCFAGGAYSYAYPGTGKATAVLNRPLRDTLFFAGEALGNGAVRGTVESALVSSENAVAALLATH